MRKIQLLVAAFAVLVAGTFVGVSDVSADQCNNTCAEDCKGLNGADQKACKLKCLGGRCGNPGAIAVAEATDEPGIDCSGDGQCNEFCDATPDPDCRVPCHRAAPGLVFSGQDTAGLVVDTKSFDQVVQMCADDALAQGCQPGAGPPITPLAELCRKTFAAYPECMTCLGVSTDEASCYICLKSIELVMEPNFCAVWQPTWCTETSRLFDACVDFGDTDAIALLEAKCAEVAKEKSLVSSWLRAPIPKEPRPLCYEFETALLCFGY